MKESSASILYILSVIIILDTKSVYTFPNLVCFYAYNPSKFTEGWMLV